MHCTVFLLGAPAQHLELLFCLLCQWRLPTTTRIPSVMLLLEHRLQLQATASQRSRLPAHFDQNGADRSLLPPRYWEPATSWGASTSGHNASQRSATGLGGRDGERLPLTQQREYDIPHTEGSVPSGSTALPDAGSDTVRVPSGSADEVTMLADMSGYDPTRRDAPVQADSSGGAKGAGQLVRLPAMGQRPHRLFLGPRLRAKFPHLVPEED